MVLKAQVDVEVINKYYCYY